MNIEFKEVDFGYDDSQFSALKNLSFSIKAGEKVAIIGRIGSGKSTIAKLLLNFISLKAVRFYLMVSI